MTEPDGAPDSGAHDNGAPNESAHDSGAPDYGAPNDGQVAPVRPRITAQGLLIKRRRFLWFALAVIILAMVLAMTASFRVTGFVLAGLLVTLAVLRGLGREEALLFAARSRVFDAVVLAGCAGGLVLFSLVAPA